MHGEVVCLDLTIVVCHGEILYPFEVWGGGIVSRVAQWVAEAGLLLFWVKAGSSVRVSAKGDLEFSDKYSIIALEGLCQVGGAQRETKRTKRRCCLHLPNLSSWRHLFVRKARIVSKGTRRTRRRDKE